MLTQIGINKTMNYQLHHSCGLKCTDIFGYSDTDNSKTPPTVTVLVNRMLPKSVTVSKYRLTVTPFSCRKGVTVTEDVCIKIRCENLSFHKIGQIEIGY